MKKFITQPEKMVKYLAMVRLVFTVFILFTLSGPAAGQATTDTTTKSFASVGQYVFIDLNGNGKRDGEDTPLPNATVTLYDSSNNILYSKITDNNGHFLFDSIKINGSLNYFKIKFANPLADYIFTTLNADGTDSSNASVADPSTGLTDVFTLAPGQIKLTLNAGIKPSAGGVLPVSINQFTGVYDGGFVHLSWRALIDINIRHFDVERSTDGVNFRQIGQVSASDETSSNTFTYLDILAEKGSNFYRLAIVDKDGNYTYSKVLTISVDVKGISLSVVYPNPFSKRVQVKIESDIDEQITIRVIDNAGNVVRSQVANVLKGDNKIAITNVDNLPSGFYFLEVNGKDRKMRTKLMKQQ